MTTMPGPQTPASLAIFRMKYCQPGEGYREVCNRVAGTIADSDAFFRELRDVMLAGEFVFGGRNMAALGTSKRVTSLNCYVSGTIHDSLNGEGGILDRFREGCMTLRMGGGIGYDFSPIRPRGSLVRGLESHASGPVSYIKMYDAMGSTISSAGERRGAQMGILRVDHPDIEEYILAKQNTNQINCFNLSIAVTDAFMNAVGDDGDFNLVFEGKIHKAIRARDLWNQIMRSTWDWGEPGVIFIDQINRMNNLGYCETIAATNPCAEQPLPPFGACLLGAVNLARLIRPRHRPSTMDGRFLFDWARLQHVVRVAVRALDNVIDVALYPLWEQERQQKDTRRMGIGVMGMANAVEALGFPYGSDGFLHHVEAIMQCIKNTAYSESARLAADKGPFKRLDLDTYLGQPFIQGLSHEVREEIKANGIRNSHLLTIAPTGTTAFVMDNVSSGIEPVFAVAEDRRVKTPDGEETYHVVDWGSTIGIEPRCASHVSAEEHIKVLCAVQKHVDSSIAKTCNVPTEMGWEEFKGVYERAWQMGAKGCSTFRVDGKRDGVRTAVQAEGCEGDRCQIGTVAS